MPSVGTPPNVVWISTHDISPHLGCYAGRWPGAEHASTPNLDRLAAQGALYSHAFAAAPVCGPSRSAVMTGCFPTSIGTMHMRTKAFPPPAVRLLPEVLREAGYHCTNAAFADHQLDTPGTVFDEFGPDAHWRGRPAGTPFFAAFHGMVTHESRLHLDDDAFAAATPDVDAGERRDPAAVDLPPYYPDTAVFRRTWARYLELIHQMDHWVGRILRELEEDGLAQDTLVVFWSDHGVGMPRAKRYAYDSGLHVPLLVRWPSRIPAGTVRDDLVHLLDLFPTTLAVCGLPVPAHVQGTPLFDPQGRFDDSPRPFAYGARDRMDEQEDTSRTVRDHRFRYIRNHHPDRPWMQHLDYADQLDTWRELRRLVVQEARQKARGRRPDVLDDVQRRFTLPSKPAEELYDLHEDPHEVVDLARDPRHAADLARLRTALDAWQETRGDLGLRPEAELSAQWWPGGVRATTAAPTVVPGDDGRGRATCTTEGASIGWTQDPPAAVRERTPTELVTGAPEPDGRRWYPQGSPQRPGPGPTWWRAWRLGMDPSPEVQVQVPVRVPGAGTPP